MPTYIVTYDLMKQGQNYDCIIKMLDAYPRRFHMQQSVWIVVTDQTCVQLQASLATCLDQNDKLFVGQISAAAWKSMGTEIDGWLVANIP